MRRSFHRGIIVTHPRTGRLRAAVFMVVAILAAAAWPAAGGRDQTTRAERSTLDFFFIDVEGGAATLIVSPSGESILIDSGFPGERDAGRIARVAREQAGLASIDHYITTHWHRDHVGGIGELVRLVPVARYYGHRIPEPVPPDILKAPIGRWQELATDPVWLRAGDRVPLAGQTAGAPGGAPVLAVHVLAGDALVKGEPEDSPQVRTCEYGHEPMPEDTSDNARSLAFHVSYGAFDLFAGGDLTWNVEHKLVCPESILPPGIDAFLVNHHGLDTSNNPVLIEALAPTVAIVNNGPAKGGEPRTMSDLLAYLGASRVFQLHRNVREGAINTAAEFIANESEDCDAAFVRLSVSPDTKQYTVAIPARNRSWTFEVR